MLPQAKRAGSGKTLVADQNRFRAETTTKRPTTLAGRGARLAPNEEGCSRPKSLRGEGVSGCGTPAPRAALPVKGCRNQVTEDGRHRWQVLC